MYIFLFVCFKQLFQTKKTKKDMFSKRRRRRKQNNNKIKYERKKRGGKEEKQTEQPSDDHSLECYAPMETAVEFQWMDVVELYIEHQ